MYFVTTSRSSKYYGAEKKKQQDLEAFFVFADLRVSRYGLFRHLRLVA
jgi:hypothetical protein